MFIAHHSDDERNVAAWVCTAPVGERIGKHAPRRDCVRRRPRSSVPCPKHFHAALPGHLLQARPHGRLRHHQAPVVS